MREKIGATSDKENSETFLGSKGSLCLGMHKN